PRRGGPPGQRARAGLERPLAGAGRGEGGPRGGRLPRSRAIRKRAHRDRGRAVAGGRPASHGPAPRAALAALGDPDGRGPGLDDGGDGERGRAEATMLRTTWGVAKWQGAGLWIPYSEVRILPPQPHLERGADGLRAEALDGKREPAVGRGDRAVPARAAVGRGGDALLGRRGVRPDQRERPRRGRVRD